MGLLTFKGGIHPDDGKKLSKDKPIVEAKPGKELVYPLSQHIGAPANPIVEIGARVLREKKLLRQVDLYLRQFILPCRERSRRSLHILHLRVQK